MGSAPRGPGVVKQRRHSQDCLGKLVYHLFFVAGLNNGQHIASRTHP